MALGRATFLISIALVLGSLHAHTHAAESTQAATTASVPEGFTIGTLQVRGASLFYRKGGAGPAVILLHGFPEDGSAYDRVMPSLARSFTVLVPDLRGIGRSVTSTPEFDAQSLAMDVQQMATALKLERPYVVGHDMGG